MHKALLMGLIFVAGGFLSTTALALDSWQGTKYVYSATARAEYALKINMNKLASLLLERVRRLLLWLKVVTPLS